MVNCLSWTWHKYHKNKVKKTMVFFFFFFGKRRTYGTIRLSRCAAGKKEWRRQLLFYGFGLAIHWSKLRQEEMRWQDLLSHLVMIENKKRWLKQFGTTSTGKTYRDYSQGTTCFINYLKRPLEVGQRAAIICVINVSVIKSTCIFFKPLSPMWEVLKVRWYNINTIFIIP